MTGDGEASGNAVAQRVRATRQRLGWSQDELAQRLTESGYPTHQTVVSKIEATTRRLSLDDVLALSRVFGVTVASLVGEGKGDPVAVAKLERASVALDEAKRLLNEVRTALPPGE